MFNMTKVKLELIADSDRHLFFEKVTRDRISYIYNRHSKTNNKPLKSYESKQETKHIIYLDANNLYEYAMSIFFQQVGSNEQIQKSFT